MPVRWPESSPIMSYTHDQELKFWGVLINPDKSPSPLLEQLCLGIAKVIATFDNYATTDITPERLAAFYRKVGGNYDVLFLDTKPAALSFIYQRLGCFHSIQPSTDPYKPPSIPSLQPHGFVRWQTIQILLDPDEHVRYLQNAVERWNIYSSNGTLLPKTIPREAFPAEPDPEMIQWHETVSQQFEFDYWKKNLLRSASSSFGTHHSQFSQKDTPAPSSSKEDDFVPSHHSHSTSASRRRYSTPSDQSSSHRHQRRQSEEFPQQPANRKLQSTLPRRSAEFVGGAYASPRAPSPPTWPKHAQPKPRGRERMTSSRPVTPENIPAHSSSDASSEDSSPTMPEPSSPSPPRHSTTSSSHYRHLSPPNSPHARRHSHEAYSRRPQREQSPDSQRRFAYRDAYTTSSSRPYDSDSGRKLRQPRVYTDEVRQSRTPNTGYREPAYGESATVPTSPVYGHVPPRFVNISNATYMVHPRPEVDGCAMDDPRRGSYRGGSVTPNPSNNLSNSGAYGRPRFSSVSDNHHHQRWPGVHGAGPGRGVLPGIVDAEYGRRSSMYDR